MGLDSSHRPIGELLYPRGGHVPGNETISRLVAGSLIYLRSCLRVHPRRLMTAYYQKKPRNEEIAVNALSLSFFGDRETCRIEKLAQGGAVFPFFGSSPANHA